MALRRCANAFPASPLCRRLATQLPQEYLTPIGHGDPRSFGEALLAPSVIYVAFVRECQRRGLKLNYVAHVTGHGWRKRMRLEEPFIYESPRRVRRRRCFNS